MKPGIARVRREEPLLSRGRAGTPAKTEDVVLYQVALSEDDMKKLVTDYTFNPAAKTVTLNSYTTIDIERLLLITNVTDNIVIYNFADATKGGTVQSNIVTLIYNTVTMDAGDSLQIYYNDIDESDPTRKYKIADIDPTEGDSYFGYVDKYGGWYIKHITTTTVRYVKGDSGYPAAWGLRADPGTEYDYFYEVF